MHLLFYGSITNAAYYYCDIYLGGMQQGMILRILRLMAMVLVALHLCGCAMLTGWPYMNAKKKEPYDAAIVPGFPYTKRSDLNTIYKVRVFWAYHLYKMGIVRNLIFSGGAVHTPYVEAAVMAEIAVQMGVPREHVFVEDSAEHSVENLYYGYHLSERMGFKRVLLATDPWQSGMIAIKSKRYHVPVDFVPAVWEIVSTKYWKTFKFHIDEEAFRKAGFVPQVQRLTRQQRRSGTRGERFRNK